MRAYHQTAYGMLIGPYNLRHAWMFISGLCYVSALPFIFLYGWLCFSCRVPLDQSDLQDNLAHLDLM